MRPVVALSQNATSEAATAGKLLAAVPSLGERSLGSAAAKVVMIEYASVTCTYSAAFNETVWPGLRRDFVETGKLRVIFREFPMDKLALSASMQRAIAPTPGKTTASAAAMAAASVVIRASAPARSMAF